MARHRPVPSLPLGFAHRGARAEAPDNTMPSFRRALQLGATALESDVWITAEGIAVLDHDGVVRRGLRRRPIAGLPLAGLPTHIPTLRRLWADCGTDFELSLDVKDPAAAAAVLADAATAGAVERVWLCSSSPARLAEWRARSERVHLVLSTSRDHLDPGAAERLAHAGVDAVNLREREWDAGLVATLHRAGLLAFGWDAQRATQLDRMMVLGVDGVYSDHVERMVRALAPQDR